MLKILFSVCVLVLFRSGNTQDYFDDVNRVIFENVQINATIELMIDASAKSIPDGIFRGNFYNFGSFDGCLAIKDRIGGVNGKYCYATLPLAEVLSWLTKKDKKSLDTYENIVKNKQNLMGKLEQTSMIGSSMGFHFGICIPDGISADQLNNSIPGIIFNENQCYSREKKLETKHWAAIGVLVVFLLLAGASTIYDVIRINYSRDLKNSKTHKALSAFSIYTNTKQLLKSSTNEDHLLCINGLRTLNMMWVILGHVFVNFFLSGAIDNWKDVFEWTDNVENMGILGATVSVDSFLTIAGLLTVYIYMKTEDVSIKKSVKSIPLMYLHRYLRLTPALAILVMVYATGLIEFLGNGPRWGQVQDLLVQGCEDRWWSTLLYFQNYMDASQRMCIDQSWYLSVDMQLFLLSPLLLIPLKKWPKCGVATKLILVVLGIGIPFYIGYSNNFNGLVLGSTTPTFSKQYYFKTHARFGPYVIGMLAGYFIHKMRSSNKTIKLHKFVSLVLWLVVFVILIGCVFDGYKIRNDDSDALMDGLYVGFNRSIWSIGISLIIFLCVSGNGGVINTFLSLPIMQLLSKLSYSMYLVHYLIINLVNLSRRETVHFSNYEAIFQFFSFFVLTFIVSFVYTLLFESPILILERLLFSKMKK